MVSFITIYIFKTLRIWYAFETNAINHIWCKIFSSESLLIVFAISLSGLFGMMACIYPEDFLFPFENT